MILSLDNITAQHISNFESLLGSSKSLKHQRSALLELIRISKDGAVDNDGELKERKKQLDVVSRKKRGTGVDVMNDPFTENGALDNLFDQ